MPEYLAPYSTTFLLLSLLMILVILQSFVGAFFRNAVEKYEAGAALPANHGSATYRMVRSFENSLENIGLLIPVMALAIATGVSPDWVYWVALIFTVSRAAHWLFYAFNIPPLRTLTFAAGFFATLALAVVTLLHNL